MKRILSVLAAVVAFSSPATALTSVALPAGDPAQEGIDADALNTLVTRAKETHTDAMVVLKNGKVVGEWYFGKQAKPIESMSITKSIVSMGVGRLIDQGKIQSLDERVYRFYPEWWQGRKERITVRHLLNHTSGLQSELTTDEIYRSPNFLQLAIAAEVAEEPGTVFRYNNKAVNLLAGVIKRSSGLRMDQYMAQEIFAPLGIANFAWDHDKGGNPHAMSGLQIKAMDLAKLGQLMLNKGKWNGVQIISERWVNDSTEPGQAMDKSCGLLWWLIPDWTKVTIDDATIQKWQSTRVLPDLVARLATLRGGSWTSDEYQTIVKDTLGESDYPKWKQARASKQIPPANTIQGPAVGYSANGYLGQSLVVFPADQLVAVRQIEATSNKGAEDDFPDFVSLVKALPKR